MQILWFPLTLLCAFSLATSDALTKRALAAQHNEYLIAWTRLLLMLPALFALLLAVPVPPLGKDFLLTLLAALPLELAALILYFKALKLSPLGLTVPFLALTPVFLLVIPYLVLGERISLAGGSGILLIAAGGYTLNLRRWSRSARPIAGDPQRTGLSLHDRSRRHLQLHRHPLQDGHHPVLPPLLSPGCTQSCCFLCLTPVAMWKGRHELRLMRQSGIVRATLLPSFFSCLELITGILALSFTNVAYMIAVKRLSLLMGVLYGHFLFGETGLRERLAGGLLMIAGVVLIVAGET